MNKQRTQLMTGYQDLVDRYGVDDPLVQDLKTEIDRFQQAGHDANSIQSGQPTSLEDAWNRHSEIASL